MAKEKVHHAVEDTMIKIVAAQKALPEKDRNEFMIEILQAVEYLVDDPEDDDDDSEDDDEEDEDEDEEDE